MQKEITVDPNTFSLRPSHTRKFPVLKDKNREKAGLPVDVRSVVRNILETKLEGVEYKPDEIQGLSKDVADKIRDGVRALDFERYKIIVNCVIGEQRGEGVRMGCKMFWDSDTDNYVEEVYVNKHLFAVVTVYGLYQY